jgi:hypothetical protein
LKANSRILQKKLWQKALKIRKEKKYFKIKFEKILGGKLCF